MKKFSPLFLFILIYIHFTICKVFAKDAQQSNVTIIDQNQNGISSNSHDEDYIYEPVRFTASGLQSFFKHKFNHPKYGQEILPNNFSDLISFFQHAKRTNQNKAYIKTVLKTFLQKLKSLEYVNAKEFIKFIQDLHSLIHHHFEKPQDEKNPQTKTYNVLYSEILNHYEVFRKTPENFLNNVSENICLAIIKNLDDYDKVDDISMSELRNLVIRFIECGLGKMIWSLQEKEDIWSQFKDTCQSLYQLKDTQFIYEEDDLNDLINSALARFEFLIEVIGAEISVEVYDKALAEVENSNSPLNWLEIVEYDEILTPKKDILLVALRNGKIKSIANKKYGILS